VGFEPTIAVLERAKTVRALDRSTTAIGQSAYMEPNVSIVSAKIANMKQQEQKSIYLRLHSNQNVLTVLK
jgi:hypothetical protein